jgi:SAM-dependent methyltransferase
MSAREVVRATLHRAGMLGVARRVRELGWTLKFARANRRFLAAAPQALPIPPARLRILVAASPDIAWFVESGRRGADSIRGVLDRNGIALAASMPVLDFGCGCGRVTRHFASFGGSVHGTDLHPALAAWCHDRLGFGHFEPNHLAPPLPFADRQFGLVYALSVFTHLPESLQRPWMEELHRVLRPGGHLVFTTHGARYADELAADDRVRFVSGQLAIKRDDRPGSNVCGAYHPEAYVRDELAGGFTVVDYVPEGATGNPWQDLWLLRRL